MKVALGVTGCIGAYKSVELLRGLQKAGVAVQVILTRSAQRFITPVTFEALSGQSVITAMFRKGENREIQHIHLAQEVALLAVVPATANIIGKFACGIADDFLTTFYLSCPAPVLLAPAMNVEMWHHAAVQANVAALQARGNHIIFPESGPLACGMEGEGRLAQVDDILGAIRLLLDKRDTWKGLRVIVTAGPTVEDIDPVRILSNRSSGKMGYALAEAAALRGADVHLVSGPTALRAPAGVHLVPVRSAAQMRDAVLGLFPGADVVVKAAAVADYRPACYSERKLKKGPASARIELVPNDDILALLGRQKKHQVLVGYAAETDNLRSNALAKLAAKNLDIVVANDVSHGVFGEDSTSATIISTLGNECTLERVSKSHLAGQVLDEVERVRLARQLVQPADRKPAPQ